MNHNNREHYRYTVGALDKKIYYPNEHNQYVVYANGGEIGYLFVDGIYAETGKLIWMGSTTELEIIAEDLGAFIERVDM